ncbi:XRE family transcriptional regulator [Thermomonospora cellulosilytica]|uniref:Zn-dependent peptidase ImmA (M78 family)/transcriptional regulator with XRE-family HTH domain n=1 Tax=Thermomonospora cellulosilytica TaxID=1411118 RepID=A0A7W3MTQ2_9ACTN|nr:XRE family transcriptional regulator [Thermomonospora cellulosilytica]MBA9001714.1 Zn-dependent peptidase ImmA (M78 family)/transcriptional regulator with XRE-family HTH domain [Thermomonospora cellulosilytica]
MNDHDHERAARRAEEAGLRFDSERLTLARRLRGLRKNQLAEAIGTTPAAIGRYEAGVHRPSPVTLSRLAMALGVPVEFFHAGHGTGVLDSAHAHFRSLRSTTQIERDQALAYGRIAADIVAALEALVELPAVDIPEHPVHPDEIGGPGPVLAARAARAAMAASPGPVPHVVRLLESRGVIVIVLPPSTERVDAFSVGAHPRPMVMFNPAKGDYWRNRFDGAHELGHLVMHADAEPGSKVVEDQANRFAAEFLMPEEDIADALPRTADWSQLAALKAEWGVSMAALLYRARTLRVMTESVYRNAMSTLSANGWRRQEPGLTRPLESPTMLVKAVELAAAAGTDRDRLATDARVTRADLDLLIPPRPHPVPA